MQPAAQKDTSTYSLQDCWNSIGIQGDASCGELANYVHCRNCPVYSGAATVLLERPLPAGYREERTRHFAQESTDTDGAWQTLAIFRIGAEWLALPPAVLAEVSGMRAVHGLPHRHGGAVRGLVNVRGSLLVCVALDWLLDLQPSANAEQMPAERRRLLVVHGERGRLAFAVDEMHGLHRFDTGLLKPMPVTISKTAASYTFAVLPWQEHSVGCLDAAATLQALERGLA